MTRHTSWLSFVLLVCFSSPVFSSSEVIPDGACLPTKVPSALTCKPGAQDKYIEEYAHCEGGGQCYMCLRGVLVPTGCQATPNSRRKRATVSGVLDRVFKRFSSSQLQKIIDIVKNLIANPSVNCGIPDRPANSWSVTCTNRYRPKSECVPECATGYKPAERAKAFCDENGKWVKSYWACEDENGVHVWSTTSDDRPVFTNCPTDTISTIDRRFSWSVSLAQTNSQVSLKQVQGEAPGSLLEYGTHLIGYTATNNNGVKATCTFAIDVKRSDCSKPSTNDTDMEFKCNGLAYRSVCHLSCKSGTKLVGSSKYIACVEDSSEENRSFWQPVGGDQATCFRAQCPKLRTPKNGALICDKQMGGTVCQMQCNEDYDIPEGSMVPGVYICGTNAIEWTPTSTVPDCEELLYPDEYFLPSEYYYYTGDCSDPEVMNQIKQQFINNLKEDNISPCVSEECTVDDIQLDCGDTDDLSRRWTKRSAQKVLKLRIVFSLKNKKRNLSPVAAVDILQKLAEKSKNVISSLLTPKPQSRAAFLDGVSGFGHASLKSGDVGLGARVQYSQLSTVVNPLVRSVTGQLSVKCKEGYVQSNKTGSCVRCSAGTYADMENGTCRPCPINTFNDMSAAIVCKDCPVHQVTISEGSVFCTDQCGVDTFSSTGRPPCYPCPEGKHQPEYGGTTCVHCSSGSQSSLCSDDSNSTFFGVEFDVSNFLMSCDTNTCFNFS